MFALYHNSGFYYAPVTKGLLGSMVLSSVVFNVPLQAYRPWFFFNYQELFEKMDVLRLLSCGLVFLDPKDLICAAILLYHFRIFERRFGCRKFASLLMTTYVLSTLLEISVLYACMQLDISLDPLPTGPYGAVFSLFVPYFTDIPRVAVTHVVGIPVTGKSLTYIIGLQMASGSPESLLLAACGVVAGLLYHSNFMCVRHKVFIPSTVGKICEATVGRLVDTPPSAPEPEMPMGATLEIQRQQQIERLEQQMIWAQFQQPQQRNFRGFGLFGNGNNGPNQAPNANGPAPAEDQVQRLVEMGFTRERVLTALRAANNDSSLAATILLQQS